VDDQHLLVSVTVAIAHDPATLLLYRSTVRWKVEDISKSTKVLLYKTLAQSMIMYNSETWTLKEHHKRRLRVFEMTVLTTLKDLWNYRKDRRRNVDILKWKRTLLTC